jgi:hypothetical protein
MTVETERFCVHILHIRVAHKRVSQLRQMTRRQGNGKKSDGSASFITLTPSRVPILFTRMLAVINMLATRAFGWLA